MSKNVESYEQIYRNAIHMSKNVEFVTYDSKIYCPV